MKRRVSNKHRVTKMDTYQFFDRATIGCQHACQVHRRSLDIGKEFYCLRVLGQYHESAEKTERH